MTTPNPNSPAAATPAPSPTGTPSTPPPNSPAKAGDAPPAEVNKPALGADGKPAADPNAKPAEAKPGDKPPAGDEGDLLFGEDKPKDGEADKKDDADKKDGEEAAVPVKLEELKLPEGVVLPEEMKGPLTTLFTEEKLTPAQQQKIIDLGVQKQQADMDFWNKTKKEWRDEIKADPELGGQNLDRTKAVGNKVIQKFASDPAHLAELQKDLVLLGLGNKRSFVKLLSNIAKATGNDTLDDGTPGQGKTGGDNSFEAKAKRMYPNMA
jgi:hypothetical protein